MLNLNCRQYLSLVLTVLLISPRTILAAETARPVLGSVESYGTVAVGSVTLPESGTLFSGDQVTTKSGSAVVQYKAGARVLLAMDTTAKFTSERVELQQGQMSFRSTAKGGPVFAASSLKLEPGTANSSADVTLINGKASVSVTEGAIRVVDPSGAPLGNLKAGEARLFAMANPAAAASAPAASAPAPAAQAGSGNKRVWLLALGGAALAATFGIAALVEDENEVTGSQAAQLASSLAALNQQLGAVRNQLNAARAAVAGLPSNVGGNLLGQINSALSQADQLAAQITALQNQLATATSEEQAQALANQIAALQNQLAALQNNANNLTQQARQLPGISPFRQG